MSQTSSTLRPILRSFLTSRQLPTEATTPTTPHSAAARTRYEVESGTPVAGAARATPKLYRLDEFLEEFYQDQMHHEAGEEIAGLRRT